MRDDEPFVLAGVWRRWGSGKEQRYTITIITTEPNELLVAKTGHDRMPAIIRRQDYQRWLEPGREEQPPIDLIRPFDSDKMKAWRVDRRVNNVRNNEPSLCEPLTEDDFPDKTEKKPKTKAKDSDHLGMNWVMMTS